MRNVGRAWGEGCGFRERKWGMGGEDGNFERERFLEGGCRNCGSIMYKK